MFPNFFTYASNLPEGSGFSLFGPAHLVWLALLAAACFGICRAYKNTQEARRPAFRKAIAFFALGLELLKDILLLREGAFGPWALPFHLCGMMLAVVLIQAYRPNKTTGEILYSLGLIGVVAALLFPDWTVYPPYNIYSIQSFVMHGILLAFILMLLTTKELRPNYRQLWRPALFLLVGFGPVYYLNTIWGTNFWFINWASEGSPLVPLQQLFGKPGYLFAFAGLLLIAWLLLYLPYLIQDFKTTIQNNHGKKQA